MKKQEHDNHSMTGHSHNVGHHHRFTGLEQWINRLDNPERDKRQLPHAVIAQLGLQNNDVVADIGAGTGYFAIRIAEAYPQIRVIAADPEPEMIDYLRTQSTKRKLVNLEPVIIDRVKPNLPVQANLALIVDTLHHIDDRVEYLKFLKRNMAHGSRIAVIDYPTESSEGPPLDHRVPAVEVINELKQVGYALEQDIQLLPNQYFLIFRRAQ